jgi:hypothetical protein
MRQCIAFRPLPRCRSAWVRCRRRRAPGERFCRRHLDALNGAMLGLILRDYPERVTRDTYTNTSVN